MHFISTVFFNLGTIFQTIMCILNDFHIDTIPKQTGCLFWCRIYVSIHTINIYTLYVYQSFDYICNYNTEDHWRYIRPIPNRPYRIFHYFQNSGTHFQRILFLIRSCNQDRYYWINMFYFISALVQITARRQVIIFYQCWVIVKWTLMNKIRLNFSQNSKLFIHENASKT